MEFTAFFDTGAAVNLIKREVFQKLSSAFPEEFVILPSDLRLHGISGSDILPYGKVCLPISLSSNSPDIHGDFYIVENVSFQSDLLIGFNMMSNHKISLYPALREIAQHTHFIPALLPIEFSNLAGVLAPIETLLPFNDVTSPTRDNVIRTDSSSSAGSHISSPSSPPDSHSDEGFMLLKGNITLAQSVQLASCDNYVVRVKIASAKSGQDILCCSQPSRCHALELESVLATIDDTGSCQIGIRNVSDHTVNLKAGVLLGEAMIYPAKIRVLDEDAPCNIVTSMFCSDVTSSSFPPPIHEDHLPSLAFPEAKNELLGLLNSFRAAVSLPGEPLGHTSTVTHAIHLTPGAKPSYIPSYRIPHSRRILLEEAVSELLKDGVIEPACSPHNAPLLLVPKKSGEWRVVVDFRKLNESTIPDRYPMPRLGDLLNSLGHEKSVFSTVDLQSGYFQVELEESSRPYTAFTTQSGQFMFKRMAQGLRNSPLTCCRLMNSILTGLIGKDVFCFLDDVIIASKSLPEHLHTLSLVMSRFEAAGLKIKLSKCSFLQREVKFLGHKVDNRGIHTLDDKIRAVESFPPPTNVDQIRCFLGMAGFYRQFIKDFSRIAQPLTQLLKKNVAFSWSENEEAAFKELKSALCSSPILAFPNFENDFILCTDASGYGVGAVLMQHDASGKSHVIAYASKLLNKAQQNYDVTNRESYAIVWALRHFRELILGYKVHVYTDHYACTEIFKGNNLTGKFARWQLTIQEFNPTFAYLPGKVNKVADALSRNVAPVIVVNEMGVAPPHLVLPSLDEIQRQQRADDFCSSISYYLESGDESNLPNLKSKIESFFMKDEILYKSSEDSLNGTCERFSQLVVPESLVDVILHHVHDSDLAGHPGRDRCFAQARQKYFWSTMRKDIFRHCQNCIPCASHRPIHRHESQSLPYPIATAPWDAISIDLLKLPITQNGYQYLFVCVDSFSRFTVLVALKDKTAKSVGRAIIDHIICPHESPRVLLSDNGTEFNNAVLQEICTEFKIEKCNIVPYSPASNGKVERCNKRILDVLRYITSARDTWDDWVQSIACSINAAIHSTTNESPHFVIYGKDKRLPYEFLHSEPRPIYNFDDYVKCRLHDFQEIHKFIHERLTASQQEMLRRQHQRASDHIVDVGDIVFARIHDRSSKLDPISEGPYRVTEKLQGHKVRILNLKTWIDKVVHIDHLQRVQKGFHCEDLQREVLHPTSQPSTSSSLIKDTHSSYRQKLRSHSRN